jgi:hypothetical protein
MAKDVAAKSSKKMSSISGIIDKFKNRRSIHSNEKSANKSANKNNIMKNIFHPDYILFDWEFFSRELEFE